MSSRLPTSARVSVAALASSLLLSGCEVFPPPFGPEPTSSTAGVELVYRVEFDGYVGLQRLSTDGLRIFTATSGSGVSAVSSATGELVWRVNAHVGDPIGEASYDNGRVFAAGSTARAWNAVSGVQLWETPLASTRSAWGHIGHAADGMYYIGTDSTLFALNGATGAVQWRVSLGDGWAYSGRIRSVSGAGDALFVCTGEPLAANGYRTRGHIVAVDRTSGVIRWRHIMEYETNWNFCMGEPTISGDLVIVGDAGGNNYVAVDRASGAFRWRMAGDPDWVGPYHAPEAVGDTLFGASADEYVTAMNRLTGAVLWRTNVGGSVWHVARCGKVLLSQAYSIDVLDPKTGAVLAPSISIAYSRDDLIASRILIHNNFAYAVGNGRFYKWRCPT